MNRLFFSSRITGICTLLVLLMSSSVLFYCSPTNGTPDAGQQEQAGTSEPATSNEQPPQKETTQAPEATPEQSGTNEPASGPEDASTAPDTTKTENGGTSSNKTCSFNRECPGNERCECKAGDCKCKIGPRGKGKNGVDTCKSGEDCESALCIEGHGGTFYCSGECKSDSDCKDKLPVCSNIAFVGQVCIRKKK